MANLSLDDLRNTLKDNSGGEDSGFVASTGIVIPKPPKPPGIGDVVKSTIKRTAGMSIKGAGQIGEDIAGRGGIASGIKGYGQELIDENPQQINSLGDIADKPLTAIAEVSSQFVPNMAGALVGGKVAEKVLGAVPHPLAKMAGRTIGALAPVFTQEVAEIRGESPQDATGAELLRQYGSAAGASALELVGGPEAKLIRGLTPIKGIKQVGREILTQAGQEGVQEIGQTGVERFGKGQALTGQEALDEYLLSGALGAIGGGVVGGGMAGIQTMMKPEQAPTVPPGDAGAVTTPPPTTVPPSDTGKPYEAFTPEEVAAFQAEQAANQVKMGRDLEIQRGMADFERQQQEIAAIASTGPMGAAVATGLQTGGVQAVQAGIVADQQMAAQQEQAAIAQEQQAAQIEQANAGATITSPESGEAERKLSFADWVETKGFEWGKMPPSSSIAFQEILAEYQGIPGKPLPWTKDTNAAKKDEVDQAKSLLAQFKKATPDTEEAPATNQEKTDGLQNQGQEAAAEEVTKSPPADKPAALTEEDLGKLFDEAADEIAAEQTNGAKDVGTTGPAAEVAAPDGKAGRDVSNAGAGVQPSGQSGETSSGGRDSGKTGVVAGVAESSPGPAVPVGLSSQPNTALKDDVIEGHVKTLINRKRFADQTGLRDDLDKAVQRAKTIIGRADEHAVIGPAYFNNAAKKFDKANDKETADTLRAVAEHLKAKASAAKSEAAKADTAAGKGYTVFDEGGYLKIKREKDGKVIAAANAKGGDIAFMDEKDQKNNFVRAPAMNALANYLKGKPDVQASTDVQAPAAPAAVPVAEAPGAAGVGEPARPDKAGAVPAGEDQPKGEAKPEAGEAGQDASDTSNSESYSARYYAALTLDQYIKAATFQHPWKKDFSRDDFKVEHDDWIAASKQGDAAPVKDSLTPGAAPRELTDDEIEEAQQKAADHLFDAPEKTIKAKDTAGEYITQQEADAQLEAWRKTAQVQNKGKNSDKTILSLFDRSGVWSAPYVEAGYNVIQVDIENGVDVMEMGIDYFADQGIDDVHGILAACPCTDFAVSGARWWNEKDEDGRTEASKELVAQTLRIIEYFTPKFWAIENPVGRIEQLTGLPKPRLAFQPHHYGDPYTKRTHLYGQFNSDLPGANVDPIEGSKAHKLRGYDPIQKMERSITPEGFSYSFFMANGDVQAGTEVKPESAANVNAESMTRDEAINALESGKHLLRYGEVTWIEETTAGKVQTYVIKTSSNTGVTFTKGPVGPDRAWGWGRGDAAQKAVESWQFEKEDAKPVEPKAADTDLGDMFDELLAEEAAKDAPTKPDVRETIKKNIEKREKAKAAEPDGSFWTRATTVEREAMLINIGKESTAKLMAGWSWDKLSDNLRAGLRNLNGIKQPAPSKKPVTPQIPTRTAGQAAKSAAKNVGMSLDDAINGLGALFGGSKLSSGLTFDEETYSKAKPYFVSAISHLKNASADMKEAMRAVVRMVLDKFGAQAATNMKPYVVRFIEDIRDGAKLETDQGVNDDRGTQGEGSAALEGVAPNDVGDSGQGGQGGSGLDAGSDQGGGSNTGTDAPGSAAGRGRGNGAAGTDPAAPGEQGINGERGAGRGTGADGSGVPGDLRADVPVNPAAVPETNFTIGDDVGLGSGGQMTKYRDNVAAIKTLKRIESERRRATSDEKRTLARYVGWGGIPNAFRNIATGEVKENWQDEVAELESILTPIELRAAAASTMNAHFTSKDVVGFMWKAAERLGFSGGMVLEPSVGTGNFIGLMPENLQGVSRVTGVELDSITARISAHLYPQSNIIHSGFEKLPIPDGSFDLAIGNPPFGKTQLRFNYKPEVNGKTIHNQFFLASADALKPGGLQIMVVSRYLMDAQDSSARDELATNMRLVAAVRLPGSAFKGNALTEVVTDVLFLQRRTPEEASAMMEAYAKRGKAPPKNEGAKDRTERLHREVLLDQASEWTTTQQVADPAGGEPMVVNSYFVKNPKMIAGTLNRAGSMRRENDMDVSLAKGEELTTRLDSILSTLPQVRANPLSDEVMAHTENMHKALGEAMRLYAEGREIGAINIESDGKMTRVIERINERGQTAIAMQEVKPSTPWSRQLAMGFDGKWFREVDVKDENGKNKKKIVNGKATKLNEKAREVYENESDVPASLRLGDTGYSRLRSLVGIRDLLLEQINLETNSAPSAQMEANRAKLRAAYEDFVKEHGYISDPKMSSVIADMPDEALLMSLETKYKRAVTPARAKSTGMKVSPASAQPSAILSRPVGIPPARSSSANSPSDAVAITLGEFGRLEVDRIAELRGKTVAEVTEELTGGDNPLAFKDPEHGMSLVEKNEYLSGNVRRKLAAAKEAGMQANITALEAIQPEPWTSDKVTPKLGSAWIPAATYSEFLNHLVGSGRVKYAKTTNTFEVTGVADSASNTAKWGTKRVPGSEIIQAILNSRRIAVYDSTRDGGRIFNQTETDAAMDKRREVIEEFDSWVFKDSDRRRSLTQLFNDIYNTRVNRQHDGSHMRFPGKVPDDIISLRRGQINAVWRGITSNFVLYDHAVGAGKTFTGIARAMERRRMGLSKKPTIVVPNHLVGEWASQVYRLYFGAKVLAAGKQDTEPRNRRRLFAKIATGDWDIVILPHSSFGFVGVSPEAEERFLLDQLQVAQQAVKEAEDEAEPGQRFKPLSVKEAEALVAKIEGRLDVVRGKKAKDRLLTFEQMGIDDLTIDESHEFKNLFYSSNLTDVRGMGNKLGSQKAFDLYLKTKLLHANGGSIAFMTGTPISNSAAEMYTIMRYLEPDVLADMGLEHFDAFRNQFVEATAKFEPTDSGTGLKLVTRLGRSWSNMRSLMEAYYAVADVVTNEDIKAWFAEDNPGKEFPLPKVAGGQRRAISVLPTPTQQRILDEVISGFNGLPMIDDIKERNAERLRLMDRARKLSLHAKVVNPHFEDEPGGKLDKSVVEITRLYKKWDAEKGTQLVFLDRSVPKSSGDSALIKEYDAAKAAVDKAFQSGTEEEQTAALEAMDKYDKNEIEELRIAQAGGWNAYQYIKDALVASGIPENEIAFVQNYNSDADKKALFDAVNDGSVRVLLGSTPRMGAGTNVQERLVGLHHIDVTWKPSDIEQREGRIIRQGNRIGFDEAGNVLRENFEVEIIAYVTERTVDAKLWDLNSTKLRMVNGIRYYGGEFEMDFDDEDAVGMAEIAAIASGDPLLLERFKLTTEVDNLYRARRSFQRRQEAVVDALEAAKRTIRNTPVAIAQTKYDADKAAKALALATDSANNRSVTINGKTVTNRRDAKVELDAVFGEATEEGKDAKEKVTIEIDGKEYTSLSRSESVVNEKLGDVLPFIAKVGGKEIIERSNFARAMRAILGEEFKEVDDTVVGTMFGIEVAVSSYESAFSKDARVALVGSWTRDDGTIKNIGGDRSITPEKHKKGEPVEITLNGLRPLISYFGEQLDSIVSAASEYRLSEMEARAKKAEADIPTLESQTGETFKREDELNEKRNRLSEVESILAARDAADKAKNADAPADDTGADGVMSRPGKGGPGLPVNAIKAFANSIVSKLPNAPKLVVTDTYGHADIPERLREKIRTSKDGDKVGGAYLNGTVYLFSNNLPSMAKVQHVLLHEMTHYGLRGMFGMELDGLLFGLYTGNKEIALQADLVKLRFPKLSMAVAVEEVLAELGAENIQPSVMEKIVAFVRRWLRKAGFTLEVTDTEIRALVGRALEFSGRNGGGGGAKVDATQEARASSDYAVNLTPAQLGDPAITGFLGKIGATTQSTFVGRRKAEYSEAGGARKLVDSYLSIARQKAVDQYESLRQIDMQLMGKDFIDQGRHNASGWVLSRMARAAEGALEALWMDGVPYLDDKAINVDTAGQGLANVFKNLAGEHHRFLSWVAANRSDEILQKSLAAERMVKRVQDDIERLQDARIARIERKDLEGIEEVDKMISDMRRVKKQWEGRAAVTERLFTPEEIAAGKTLNRDKMEDGRSRAAVYAAVFRDFKKYQTAVLDIAEQTGLIEAAGEDEFGNPTGRALWESEFYVPFYRVIEDDVQAQAFRGPSAANALVRQKAFEHLKGGTDNLNDLMQNTLANFHHLLAASLKNQAAVQALDNAAKVGAASVTLYGDSGPDVVWVNKEGQKVFYRVHNPAVLESITALSWQGFRDPMMRGMETFKRWYTASVTANPAFIARNLLRDSIHSIAVSGLKKNPFKNVAEGWKEAAVGDMTHAKMRAGGGAFHFGQVLGDDSKAAERLINEGVPAASILNSAPKLRAMWEKYSEFGSRVENVSRAALYAQQRADGKSHLEASFDSRDLLDFSARGSAGAVRALTYMVPFLNARIQGLDKLARSFADPQQRGQFMQVAGTVVLASLALYLIYMDDPDFKEREEWDRDTYWWFKIGDQPFRIPKPFEVGAIGTVAERIAEQIMDDEASGKLFGKRMLMILGEQFAFNPVPQAFMPTLEVWANKDTFTDRPIESLGMERLSPTERIGPRTTLAAQGISETANAFGMPVSPMQVDHLIKGYFGWIGATLASTVDWMAVAGGAKSEPSTPLLYSLPVIKDLARGFVPEQQGTASKYVSQFYDQNKELQQIFADYRNLVKMGDKEGAAAFSEEHAGELRTHKLAGHVADQLGDINRQIRKIEMSDMPSAQKHTLISSLSNRKKLMAQRASQKIAAAVED